MTEESTPSRADYAGRHLRFGWWSLLVFLSLGLVLDALHGFKVGWYLDVANEARRLTWTLAHAHGVLLSILNVVFSLTLSGTSGAFARLRLISGCLIGATVLMPVGFFLGGILIHGGDPGIGIFAVPPGALLLFAGVYLIARQTARG